MLFTYALAALLSRHAQDTQPVNFAYLAAPGEVQPGEALTKELTDLGRSAHGFIRLKTGQFVSIEGGQPLIVFSSRLAELKRLDLVESALLEIKTVPKEPVFPLASLGTATSGYVLDYLATSLPLSMPPSGRLPANTRCAISSTMTFEFTDGTRTVSATFRETAYKPRPENDTTQAFNKSKEEQRKFSAQLAEGPILGIDPVSPEAKRKWEQCTAEGARIGGYTGLNIRFFGSIPRKSRTVLYETAVSRFSLLLKNRQREVEEVAQPLIKEMANRFPDLHGVPPEISFSDISERWKANLRGHFESQPERLGFSSADEALKFLESSRLTKGSAAGVEIIVRLMPQGGDLVVTVWPQ